jgi:hypothetical protein
MESFMMCSRHNHYSGNQMAEDEIGGICDTTRTQEERRSHRVFVGKLNIRPFGDLSVGGRVIKN